MKNNVLVLFCTLATSIIFAQNNPLIHTPSLSPDGKIIAFNYQGDIWTVDLNGENLKRMPVSSQQYRSLRRKHKHQILLNDHEIDAFNKYCKKWSLKVNINKTKVVIFSRGKIRKLPVFRFGNDILKIVDDYVYLGTTFNYNHHFKKAQNKQIIQTLFR